jgi:uncharacterized protein (TIGR04255 family)
VTFHVAFGGSQPDKPAPQVHEHGVEAFFFKSGDEKEVAQFRVDGFTVNRLAPYTSWADLLPRSMRLLEIYLRVSRPKSITRVATRYINRLRLPSARFAEYLTQPPRSVPGTTGTLVRFLETASTSEDSGVSISFAQTLELPVTDPETPTLLLDIDAFIPGQFEPTVDETQARLAVLHDRKNRVFFGSLTDAAMRFYL